jgi:FkbM family methyltransferase
MFARITNALRYRFKQLTFQPHVIDRRICGEEIRFLIGDLFGDGWYGPQHDPWPELHWIKDHGIRRGDTVVDCGANHGFSTVLFARWTGATGKVHAIEPLPHNVGILRKNLQLNDVNNVVIHQVAAGELNGIAKLTDHPNASVTEDPSTRFISADMRRLDDEIKEARIDFIKIDVEGYEFEVLKGAERLLATRPRLALELHVCMYRQPLTALEELFRLLRPHDYSIEVQPAVDGPVHPYDTQDHSPARLAACEIVHLFCRN